jgi:hypothetical protein
LILAQHGEKLADPFHATPVGVPNLGIAGNNTRINPKIAELADIGVGGSLKNKSR